MTHETFSTLLGAGESLNLERVLSTLGSMQCFSDYRKVQGFFLESTLEVDDDLF